MVDFSTPILIVDDDLHMRHTLRSMLRHIGFNEIVEDDGKDTMTVLRNGRFGLVLSDLMMKPTSGLDLLKKMRNDSRFCGLLFIMVTGAARAEAVRSAVALGVDAYIVKPFNTRTMQLKVCGVLDRGGTRRQVSAEMAEENRRSEEAKLAELTDHITELLDLAQAQAGDGDVTPQHGLVALIRDYLDRAIECGVDDECRAHLEASFGDLPSQLLPKMSNGLSPKPLVEKSSPSIAIDRRAAVEPDNKTGRDVRRYKRHASPVLHVTIGGNVYNTVDWSIGGLRVARFFADTEIDTQLDATATIAGIGDREAVFGDRCRVVRHDSKAGLLILHFESCLTPTLKIIEYLVRHYVQPTVGNLDAA